MPSIIITDVEMEDTDSFVLHGLSAFEKESHKLLNETNGSGLTNWSESEGILRHSLLWTIVLISAYALVLIVGIVGNVMVGCVLVFRPNMRTVTNLFILNLAIADLFVVLFCVAPTLLSNIFIRKYSIPFLIRFKCSIY